LSGLLGNRDPDDGAAGPDLVAVLKKAAVHSCSIDVGAVAAAHIEQNTIGRIDFDEEVDAREKAIRGGQPEMSLLGTANQEGVMTREGEDLPRVGARRDGQRDAHEGILG
jgi:hypothetical protein